jgi:hypothetical protein
MTVPNQERVPDGKALVRVDSFGLGFVSSDVHRFSQAGETVKVGTHHDGVGDGEDAMLDAGSDNSGE